MKKQKNFQSAVIGVLAVAILLMSVGFAAYAQVLNINGTTTVAGNKWSIHFDSASVQPITEGLGNGNVTLDGTSTTATFTATLNKPGDKFGFTVDVINDGTFDAKLDTVRVTPLTAAQDAYLNYTVVYDGMVYNAAETSGINSALTVSAPNNRKTATIIVEYDDSVSADALPQNNVEVSLSASFNFVQN